MAEFIQIIIGIIFLVLVFIATRYGIFLRIKGACNSVIKDLERRGAFDAASAVELPYAKKNFFHIGLRDYRPKGVQSLLEGGIIGTTESGKFYLKVKPADLSIQ
ncbi:MAG: hypothetical protein JW836_13925 [Deltaproteobacteria bacterium]|nr:hypothetical protein [Deltaproteobacteria bacterium]